MPIPQDDSGTQLNTPKRHRITSVEMTERSPYFKKHNEDQDTRQMEPESTSVPVPPSTGEVAAADTSPLRTLSLDPALSHQDPCIDRNGRHRDAGVHNHIPDGPHFQLAARQQGIGDASIVQQPQDRLVMVSSTGDANAIKQEHSKPEVIVIDDSDGDAAAPEDHVAQSQLDINSATYLWRKTRADAEVKKTTREMENIMLASKTRLARGANTDLKLQPNVLDDQYEVDLKLKLVAIDITYFQNIIDLADLHLRYLRRGSRIDEELPELQIAKAKIHMAWHEGESAFIDLVQAFPGSSTMDRPAEFDLA